MASVAMPSPPVPGSRQSVVMDTRTPSPLHSLKPGEANGSTPASPGQPGLSEEVEMLSTKLINAINFQTTLDDQLQQTRHELEMSKRQFERLQAEKKYLDDMISDGILIRKAQSDSVVSSLQTELAAEKIARETAEKSRKQTESELENLTSALFEEANEMVASARKETEAADRRNSQLRNKLNDTELLLASQQEQLQDLKSTMEKMSERGDNGDSIPTTPTHPPSAGLFDGLLMSPNLTFANSAESQPEHPLHFAQLLIPVLRSDTSAYLDFQDLLQAARRAGHLRASSSGSAQNGPVATLGSLAPSLSGSSPNLPGAFSFGSGSPSNSVSYPAPLAPLKDSKFWKRSLVEDIEPTLRLDLAPGLSFLSRRSVLSAFLQGSLVVEPFQPGPGKFYGGVYACALCGENRKSEQFARRHRFRVSEEDSAQRYPLCDYCLGRIRSSGDFITFLRMVRDGHWRADTEEEQKGAWEESVRLRERMFWARIGGGVVPSAHQRTPSMAKSGRQSLDGIPEEQRQKVVAVHGSSPSEDISPTQVNKRASLEDKLVQVFQRHRKSMSIGKNLPDFSAGTLSPRSPTFERRITSDASTIVEEKKHPKVVIKSLDENESEEHVPTLASVASASSPAVKEAETEYSTPTDTLQVDKPQQNDDLNLPSPATAAAALSPVLQTSSAPEPKPEDAESIGAMIEPVASHESTKSISSEKSETSSVRDRTSVKSETSSIRDRSSALTEQRKRISEEKKPVRPSAGEGKQSSGVLARVRAMEAQAGKP